MNVKITSGDVLAVLRRFQFASDSHTPRSVERLKTIRQEAGSLLVPFAFENRQFYALFDNTLDGEKNEVVQRIHADAPEEKGELLPNPHEAHMFYALPYKGTSVYLFAVTPQKRRLDSVLADNYPAYSRSTWQKYIKTGCVSVNGAPVYSINMGVTEIDDISVQLPNSVDYSEKELPILYIDNDVIVIDKPAGILTHTKGELNDEFTAADFFRRYTTFGVSSNRPGIVHRLDRDTSGVLMGARNPAAAAFLQAQFSARKIKKYYSAVIMGQLKEPRAEIDLPIGRNPSAPSTFRVDPKGKSAVTYYTVLAGNAACSLVRLQPVTGRTHQLRVHMAYLGHPILGDRVYGKPAERLFLHAERLEVTLPGGAARTFQAPLPPEFTEFFPGAAA